MESRSKSNDLPPLCVDLDGTLLLSDSLLESFCLLLRKAPWVVLALPLWLARGRANLKEQIARRVHPDIDSWPLNSEVLAFVQEARQQGRKIVLATAANHRIAAAMQTRLQLFDEVLASDASLNLSGETKAAALVQRLGEKQFDYLGDNAADLPVWKMARLVYVAGDRKEVVDLVKQFASVERVFATPGIGAGDWARALRIHQWSKNLLILVPVLGAHKWMDPARMPRVLLGVAAFSICASSVYLLNDLLDLEADRQHHSKRNRPLASGKIPLIAGLVGAPVLLALSAGMALALGWKFAAVFGAYYLLTLWYSLRLKQIELVDVLTLAGLYGIRVLAGGVAAEVMVSDWLMMYSLFVFLSLAFAKRFTELRIVGPSTDARMKGRAYKGSDADVICSMGVGSGYVSVLVLAMYINHPSVTSLYHQPHFLWLACPVLLYWISRIWLLASRGAMHDDPIVFALRDWPSWVVVALLAIIGFAAGPK